MTIGSSILLIAIGAILKWAVTAHVKGFNIQTAGVVLLVVGIIGLILSLIYTLYSGRNRRDEVVVHDPRDRY
jgi:hypothetical protein